MNSAMNSPMSSAQEQPRSSCRAYWPLVVRVATHAGLRTPSPIATPKFPVVASSVVTWDFSVTTIKIFLGYMWLCGFLMLNAILSYVGLR